MRFESMIAAGFAALFLSACATPAVLRGEFAELTPQQVAQNQRNDTATTPSRVRWGGTILSMKNSQEESCFEILGRPLDYSGRPVEGDQEQGRFLAYYKGFKDPEVFKPGREVTIVGTLAGVETRKIGEFSYTYPKVTAADIYLWRERRDPPATYIVDPFFYGPFFYPYPYYYPAFRPVARYAQTSAPESKAAATSPEPSGC
ncbi:outer membrane lipoprotein [Fontimonas thermophila]|uniref:Outer membrane lipoprotein n=1 Tax=Fontimonas thermophila TaxID=1076937 RepID=A0A1I2J7A3_9GAMM|nr:Slp family lipoprotein [Fontimonas thermophila]SFF50672.1 outer membrane lipoprotein [Fontimonas thermophila]